MNQQPDNANPYVAPAVDVNAVAGSTTAGLELATAGTRLKAAFFDWLFIGAPATALGIVMLILWWPTFLTLMEAQSRGEPPPAPPVPPTSSVMVVAIGGFALFVWMIGFSIYQWVRITNTGQSVGKAWTGIKIVKKDGSPVTFGSGVGLRNWLRWVLSSIPYLGAAFYLADVLFIFRDDRRCLHDHIAGTIVVNAPSTTTQRW